MTMATSTEVQNDLGRSLQTAIDGDKIAIAKNGKEVARLISREKTVSFLTESLVGILKTDVDEKAERMERAERHDADQRR